jgi:antitoxin component of MazEF toxin-antitoxin module
MTDENEAERPQPPPTSEPKEEGQKRKPKYTLAELLAKITPENRHEYIDFGPTVGKEVW